MRGSEHLTANYTSLHYMYEFYFASQGPSIAGNAKLVVDPFESYGNQLMAINDPRGSRRSSNCEFIEYDYKGWPHVCVVALGTVEPGAELLLEYGTSTYWKDMEMISYSIAKPLKQACERKAAECAPFAEAIRHCKEELKERREKEALLQAEVEQLRAENARLRASPALSQLE